MTDTTTTNPPAGQGQGQRLRFAQISALSFVCYLAITALAVELLGLPPWGAALLAATGVTKMNFWLLRRYVFPGSTEAWPLQLLRFAGSVALFRVGEYAAFVAAVELLPLAYLACNAAILAVSFVLKFLVFRNHVFTPAAPRVQHA